MGFGNVPGQGSSLSPTQIRDGLQSLTGINRLDAGAVKNLPSGGGLSAWQLKTANYTAIAGDRIRLQLSGDLTITCPLNPSSGDEIEIQRLDTTVNSLIIDPNGKPFKSQTNKDGLFDNGNIGLSERISYIDSTIGWLPQRDLLTYQTHTAVGGGFSNSTLLLRFDGADNSTVITDSSANAIGVTAIGTTTISTTQSKFGGSSLYLPGSSGISIADTAALEFLTNNFTIEFWQNLTTAGQILGKGDATTASGSAISWTYSLSGCYFYCNGGTTTVILPTVPPVNGTLKHVAITRDTTMLRYFIDGIQTSSVAILATDSINNVPQPLQLGTYGPGSCTGFIDEFAIDIGVARYTANFTPPTVARVS
jgi:Concanavalin A-like lectin/glucanases superfamily